MKNVRQRKYLIALLALLVVFVGCRGESPTAPPPSGGPGPGGGGPPTNVTITLTAANPNPNAGSSTLISANVREGNNPVPNGTAVEFGTTSPGLFSDVTPPATSVVKTTSNGIASATLTSASPATVRVTAVVGNAVQQIDVTFKTTTDPGPTPSPGPTITAITPSSGLPTGGQLVTITGTGFQPPVKVFFEINGVLREALVTSVQPTQIQVLTPAVDLGAGQTLTANVIVFTEQGTPAEKRVQSTTPFTFRRAQITPVMTTLSPASGPIDGGTRITIFGDAFEAPVQVFFGAAEAQVINVTFSQIIVMSPPGRDTAADGSGVVTGPVSIRVVNINSGTSATLPDAFRYTPKMQITAAGPTEGPFTGGTRVTIDGTGFDQPVAVEIGGVAAQPVFVSGTRIVAITSGVEVSGCVEQTGPITVTNIDNGDQASGPTFTFRVPTPIIISVSGPVPLGGNLTVRVFNAFGIPRIKIGDVNASITSEVLDPATGITTFVVVVPTTLTLDTINCPGFTDVTSPVPTPFDITYLSVTSGCADTLADGVIVTPTNTPVLTVEPPAGFTPFSARITPASAGPPPTPASVTNPPPQTVFIINTGAGPLTITSFTQSGPDCANFTISPPPPTLPSPSTMNQCESAPITVQYNGTTVPASHTCTITVTTNAGTRSFTLTGTSQ